MSTSLSKSLNNMLSYQVVFINPFVPNAPFLYPLKISENLTFSNVFRGCIGNKWVKEMNLRLMFIKAFLRTCKLPRHFPMKLPIFFQHSEKLQVCLSMHELLLPPHIKGLKKTQEQLLLCFLRKINKLLSCNINY